MSSIVYWTNKQSGKVYAYRSESYWDKEKKQPRSKRVYLGPVDPVTGEIIQGRRKTKTEARKIAEQSSDDIENEAIRELKKKVEELEAGRTELMEEIKGLKKENTSLKRIAKKAMELFEEMQLDD